MEQRRAAPPAHAALAFVIALAGACSDASESLGLCTGTQEVPATVAANYQLVLQFQGDALADYDAMIALEDSLIDELGDTALVDGHDVGMGTVNIFIFTSDPQATFERAKTIVAERPAFEGMRAAYRSMVTDNEPFLVIWPIGAENQDFSP